MTIIFKKVKSITHCEINTGLSEIVAHNFRQLGIVIDCKVGDSLNTLESIKKWDWIYIDPSDVMMQKAKFYA
jgi:protein-L-isoaspartate O-methyltransferase